MWTTTEKSWDPPNLGLKEGSVQRGWRKLHHEELKTLYSSTKKALWRRMDRWKVSRKSDGVVGYMDTNWIQVAMDKVMWQAFRKTVINL